MRILIATILVMSLSAQANVVMECSDATCTGDSAVSLDPTTSGYKVIINNEGAGANQVRNIENATEKLFVIDLRNSGISQDLEMDLRTRYNPMNAVGAAHAASKAVVVADTVGNVSINSTGFAGANGKSFDQLCGERMMSGAIDAAYGTGSLYQSHFNARRTPSDPAYSPTAPAGRCDSGDYAYLKSTYTGTTGASTNLCTATGGTTAFKNHAAASVTGNKIKKETLRKCVRPSFNPAFRQCSYRVIRRVWTLTSTINTSGMYLFNDYINDGAYVLTRSSSFSAQTMIGWGWNEGTTVRGTITIDQRDADYTNGLNAAGVSPVPKPQLYGQYDNSAQTYGSIATTGVVSNHMNTGQGVSHPAILTTSLNQARSNMPTGNTAKNMMAGVSGRSITATITSETVQAVNQTRKIATTGTCLTGEIDRGTFTDAPVPEATKWVPPDESCNDITKEQSHYVSYQDNGLSDAHNLSSNSTVQFGNPTTTRTVTVVPRTPDTYTCTPSFCPGSILSYNEANFSPLSVQVEDGQYGAMHGKTLVATFSLSGTVGVSTARGLDGDNGQTPGTAGAAWAGAQVNFCATKDDQDSWSVMSEPEKTDRESIRFIPEVNLLRINYTPINFVPPTKVKTTWPAVGPRDNTIYTHTNYGIRKLILDSAGQ